jgi:hypothetical protein
MMKRLMTCGVMVMVVVVAVHTAHDEALDDLQGEHRHM